MKPIDRWSEQDILLATQSVRALRESVLSIGETLENLPDYMWAEGLARYNHLVMALSNVFGEDWLEWLDVDRAPAE